MKTVKVYIERSQYGYSAYMDDTPLDYSCLGEGKTVEETINDFNNAYNEMREHYAKEDKYFEEITYEFFDARASALRAAIDGGESSPDVIDFDRNSFLAELKARSK